MISKWENLMKNNSKPTFQVTSATPVITAGTLRRQAYLDVPLNDNELNDMDFEELFNSAISIQKLSTCIFVYFKVLFVSENNTSVILLLSVQYR